MADDLTINEIISECYDEINGGIDVNVQDPTAPPFQYYLMREDKTDITLTAQAEVDDDVLNVSAGHGFTVDSYLTIRDGNNIAQSKVKSVTVNAIGIFSPLSSVFTTNSTVARGTIEMDTDGSVTPQVFKYYPSASATTPVDLQTIRLTMINSSEPDDSKFGNISELTNGLFFRRENSIITNYGNFRKNLDFAEFGATVVYSDKAGGGAWSTTVTFDVKRSFGTVLRMSPVYPDVFLGTVRDSLTGITQMRISLMGQFTTGEE